MQVAPYAPKDRLFVLGGLVKGLGQLNARDGVDLPTSARWAYGWSVRYLGRKSSHVLVLTDGRFQAPRGFLAAEDLEGVRVVHWLHVEPSWRRTGAAKGMLDAAFGAAPVVATSLNVEGAELLSGRKFVHTPHVRWALTELDDWKLSSSSKWHRATFEQVAEWLVSTPQRP